MANEYTTVTVNMTRINAATPDGTLYAELNHVVTLANNDTVYPEKKAFTVTAGAASISLACTATAIKNANAPYVISFAPTGQAERILGRIVPTASASALNLSDLLEVGATGVTLAHTIVAASNITFVASIAALQAITGMNNLDRAFVLDIGIYRYASASASTAVGSLIVTPSGGSGRWHLEEDGASWRPFANVRQFGATGLGVAAETAYLQATVDSLPDGGVIYVPPGTYLVDTDYLAESGYGGLKLRSNQTLLLDPGAILKAATSADEDGAIVRAWGLSNVTIQGGTIQGDRATHVSAAHEHGMGIDIRGCSNVTIKDIITKDCQGDGVYLGVNPTGSTKNTYVNIYNLTSDNNRRNALSNTGTDYLRIVGSTFKNTNGAASGPWAGVDIEPDSGVLRDTQIVGCKFINNDGSGVENHFCRDVVVLDCYFETNQQGVLAYGESGREASIDVRGCNFYNNERASIHMRDYLDLTVTDCRMDTLSDVVNGHVISQTVIASRRFKFQNCVFINRGVAFYTFRYSSADTFSIGSVTGCTFVYTGTPGPDEILGADLHFADNVIVCTSTFLNTGLGGAPFVLLTLGGTDAGAIGCRFLNATVNPARFTLNGWIRDCVFSTYFEGGAQSGSIQTGRYAGDADRIGTLVWNPADLADGAGETSSAVAITGAAFGDSVDVIAPYDLQGITATAWVSSAGNVKARLQNETAGANIDLIEGTWIFRVRKL